MEVWLLNAAHMKAMPGRKTDVRDAEWIAQLLEHGLLSPSFVPPPPIRRLRTLTRYRLQLMGDRTREAVRLELMLEDASIKLSAVASSVTTVSARVMLRATIDGERDALCWPRWRGAGCVRRSPILLKRWRDTSATTKPRMAGAILDRLELVEHALVDLDEAIRVQCFRGRIRSSCCRLCRCWGEGRAGHCRGDRRGRVPVRVGGQARRLGGSRARSL